MSRRNRLPGSMSAAEVLRRLQLFLLALSSLLFVGTLLELWLVNHTGDAIQWLAFIIGGLGLLATLSVLFRIRAHARARKTILVMRACMSLVVLGSLFGIYQHVSSNIAFEREIYPNATFSQLAWKGLGGANPLLAPGTLAVAALLALAGTYNYSVDSDLDTT
jgi:hypothetical protein